MFPIGEGRAIQISVLDRWFQQLCRDGFEDVKTEVLGDN